MEEQFEQIWRQFLEQLKAEGQEFVEELDVAADEAALYASQRSQHLSTLVGQPGFAEAAKAERDNIAIKAGILVVERADDADQRILAALGATLEFAAKVLAALV